MGKVWQIEGGQREEVALGLFVGCLVFYNFDSVLSIETVKVVGRI